MKWLGAVAVLCVGVGALLLFPGRQERACFKNLIGFDHALNCSYHVYTHEKEGIVSDGVWIDKEPVLGVLSEEELRCPITGTDYVLTFTVGEHPYCPVHGRLLEKYGYRTHGTRREQWPPGVTVKPIAGLLILLLGVLLAVIAGIIALVRLSRPQGRMAQPSDGRAEINPK